VIVFVRQLHQEVNGPGDRIALTKAFFRIRLGKVNPEAYALNTSWSLWPGVGQLRLDMNKYRSPYKWKDVSSAERGLPAELDFFFPACPSALMLSFSAADHWSF